MTKRCSTNEQEREIEKKELKKVNRELHDDNELGELNTDIDDDICSIGTDTMED